MAWRGGALLGAAGPGKAWQIRHGVAWRGRAWRGKADKARRGLVWLGAAGLGMAGAGARKRDASLMRHEKTLRFTNETHTIKKWQHFVTLASR